MTLIDVHTLFSTDEKCRELLKRLRWPNGPECLRCKGPAIQLDTEKDLLYCVECDYQFTVTSGTIFHDTHLPLLKWFVAVYLLCESRKGMSANQIKRTLGISYKTAWYLCHRIRAAVKEIDREMLTGTVEVDETFIGGKAKNMHKKEREKKIKGRGASGKTMVLAAIQRGGGVRLRVESQRDRETLHAFIHNQVSVDAERIMTDEWEAYKGCGTENTKHESVNHGKDEYVRSDVHTNSAESVFSLFKRSIVGAYHQVSVKHLDRYLDEFNFRFDNRKNPDLFVNTLRYMATADPLTFAALTGKPE
jgi:transposase-like protein